MTVKHRLKVLECYVLQNQADPARQELDQLDQAIGAMSKAERIAFVESWLAADSITEDWQSYLTDWRDFLKLKGTPTWPDFDRETMCYVPTPESRRWGEILTAHYRWGGWTGWGLPPELREYETIT